jgi:hypothetical protein
MLNKLYGSSSAFLWGRVVFTDNKTGCLRNILLQSQGVREGSIAQKYIDIGNMNEERYEKHLKDSGIKYDREFVIKQSVPAVPSVYVSGRVDFIRYLDSGAVVDELKATESKTKLREVIKNGQWVTENLAQLVGYMVALKTSLGRLTYGYYEVPKGKKAHEFKLERAFEVLIDDAGRICVDSAPTQFTVHDQIAHTNAAARVIQSGEIWDRPYLWSVPFKSPCQWCPFKASCDAYDAGQIKDLTEFVKSAKAALLTKQEGVLNEQQPNAEV